MEGEKARTTTQIGVGGFSQCTHVIPKMYMYVCMHVTVHMCVCMCVSGMPDTAVLAHEISFLNFQTLCEPIVNTAVIKIKLYKLKIK